MIHMTQQRINVLGTQAMSRVVNLIATDQERATRCSNCNYNPRLLEARNPNVQTPQPLNPI